MSAVVFGLIAGASVLGIGVVGGAVIGLAAGVWVAAFGRPGRRIWVRAATRDLAWSTSRRRGI